MARHEAIRISEPGLRAGPVEERQSPDIAIFAQQVGNANRRSAIAGDCCTGYPCVPTDPRILEDAV
jgi:hypothetical protein